MLKRACQRGFGSEGIVELSGMYLRCLVGFGNSNGTLIITPQELRPFAKVVSGASIVRNPVMPTDCGAGLRK